jgi:hypothetical protein
MKSMIKNMIESCSGLRMSIDCSSMEIQAGKFLLNNDEYKYIKVLQGGDNLMDISILSELTTPDMIDKIIDRALDLIEA